MFDAYGRCQGAHQHAPEPQRSKRVLTDRPDSDAPRAQGEAIRSAWKRLTGDSSMLRVTQPPDAPF